MFFEKYIYFFPTKGKERKEWMYISNTQKKRFAEVNLKYLFALYSDNRKKKKIFRSFVNLTYSYAHTQKKMSNKILSKI